MCAEVSMKISGQGLKHFHIEYPAVFMPGLQTNFPSINLAMQSLLLTVVLQKIPQRSGDGHENNQAQQKSANQVPVSETKISC